MLGWSSLFAVVLLAALPGTGEARQVAPDPGGWIEVSGGTGWSGLSCRACRTTLRRGPELRVGMGRHLRSTLRFGAEVGGWTSWGEDVRDLVGHVHLVGGARPGNGRLGLRGGIGIGHYRALHPADGDDIRSTGLGFQLGVDLHLPVGDRIVVSPQAGVSVAGFGEMKSGDSTVAKRAGFQLLRVGVTVFRR